jgi:heme-degrading monooxygenase HmoA
MAYTYQVKFKIKEEQREQLRIGANLEKIIGYLRTLLPGEPGFISVRGMHSMNIPGPTRVVVQSTWDLWEDLLLHQKSGLAEQKVLVEFGPHIAFEDLVMQIYKEVS